MTGTQLRELVATGLDPDFAQDTPHAHRGRRRGFLHLSGAKVNGGLLFVGGQQVEANRVYRVAGSDWELDAYGGYANPEWGLRIRYDMPYILREAVEDHLQRSGAVAAPSPRVHGALG